MNNRLTALEQDVGGQQAQSMQQVPQMQQQVANNLQCRACEYKQDGHSAWAQKYYETSQDEAHQHYIDKAAKYLKRVEVYRTLK